jgi:hypothetical protein
MLSRWRAMMAITIPGGTKEASVSLTSELADPRSPLTIWLHGQLPNRAPAAGHLAAALHGAPTLTPRSAGRGYPWATVGGAISQRITFAFAAVPPHAALLGAAQLADTEQLVHLAAAAFPAVRRFVVDPRRAGYVAVAGGRCWWRAGHDDPPELEAAIWAAPDPTVQPHLGFFCELAARLEHDTPPGRPRSDQAEQTLLADCYLLALYETMYRSGRTSAIADALVRAGGPVGPTWLRGLVPDPVRDDLQRLGRLFAEDGYDQLAALGGPATAAPAFIEHWADGDLVVGDTLVDVKATVRPLPLEQAWLDQLLGYVLLDRGDWYGIRRVGVYLARQGRLVVWPLEELLVELAGRPVALQRLREEFAGLVERLLGGLPDFPLRRLWVTRTPPPWPVAAR